MVALIPVAVIGVVVVLLIFAIRTSAARIERLAGQSGISQMQRRWFLGAGIRGHWQGYRTDWIIRGGGKHPLRAIVDVFASAPGRLLITRKQWWNPALFGPPAIDMPMYPDLVVRGDDSMLATRLLGDSEILPLIMAAMTHGLDRLELMPGSVRVQRFCRSGGVDRDERMREAFTLTTTVVTKLGFPPAG